MCQVGHLREWSNHFLHSSWWWVWADDLSSSYRSQAPYQCRSECYQKVQVSLSSRSWGHSHIDYFVKAKSNFKARSTAQDVEIFIPVPEDVDTPQFNVSSYLFFNLCRPLWVLLRMFLIRTVYCGELNSFMVWESSIWELTLVSPLSLEMMVYVFFSFRLLIRFKMTIRTVPFKLPLRFLTIRSVVFRSVIWRSLKSLVIKYALLTCCNGLRLYHGFVILLEMVTISWEWSKSLWILLNDLFSVVCLSPIYLYFFFYIHVSFLPLGYTLLLLFPFVFG